MLPLDRTQLFDVLPPRDWVLRARCRGAPLDLFVSDTEEDSVPSPEAKSYCNECPVQRECLSWALGEGDDVVGVWGGTSSYQRRQLLVDRSRARCPNCRTPHPVGREYVQYCRSCGVSWAVA